MLLTRGSRGTVDSGLGTETFFLFISVRLELLLKHFACRIPHYSKMKHEQHAAAARYSKEAVVGSGRKVPKENNCGEIIATACFESF